MNPNYKIYEAIIIIKSHVAQNLLLHYALNEN